MTSYLEKLVQENYSATQFSKECIDEVVAFVNDTATVRDRSVKFIKNLTKVAYGIWKCSPELLEAHLEKIYLFQSQGVELIVNGETAEMSPERIKDCESHFHGYMGSIAYQLAGKKNNLEWLEKSYGHRKRAGDIVLTSDPRYAATSYGFASDNARELFQKMNDHKWLIEAYNLRRTAAAMAKDFDHLYSSHCHSFAGDYASQLYSQTNDKQWIEHAAQAYYAAGTIAMAIDSNTAAKRFEKAGDIIYINRFRLEKDQLKFGIEAYRQIPEYVNNIFIKRKLADLKKLA